MWSKEDIQLKETNMGVHLFPEERIKVLKQIKENYDANFGINWGTLEGYIEEVVKERK